jgi:hypothetical protein
MDMTSSMGYLFICYECDPIKQSVIAEGPGTEAVNIEDEEVSGTRYFKVALCDVEFSIKLDIKNLEGEPKYKRHFTHAGQIDAPPNYDPYGEEEEAGME